MRLYLGWGCIQEIYFLNANCDENVKLSKNPDDNRTFFVVYMMPCFDADEIDIVTSSCSIILWIMYIVWNPMQENSARCGSI